MSEEKVSDATLKDYRRGLDNGTLKSASPNIVRELLDEIERLRKRQAGFSSDIFAACLECHDYDSLYKRVMGVLDEYDYHESTV